MPGNSHKHTRLVNYNKKRRGRSFRPGIWLIIPIAALLAFILAIILGNTLGSMVPDGQPVESTPQKAPPTQSQSPHGPIEITAHHVTLSGITNNTAVLVANQIPEGAEAVSMTLFDANKAPYYYSEVAVAFGNRCGELTLKNVFRPISELDLYASVLFPSSLVSNTEPAKSAVISAYEASLARELYEAGADELVIHFSPLGLDTEIGAEDFMSLVSDHVCQLRLYCPGLRIGISLSPELLTDRLSPGELNRLCGLADFCALDTTSADSVESLTELLIDSAPSVMAHEMRLLLSKNGRSEEFLASATLTLERLKMKNVQYVG